MSATADVAVVGGGVIGLTTAICAAERGMSVIVLSADDPLQTTSRAATAMIGPCFGPPTDRLRMWEAVTVSELARSPAAAGAHLCRGMMAARDGDMTPPGIEDRPGYAPCHPEELPDGFLSGVWVTVPIVDMDAYLPHLLGRLGDAGGRVVRRRLDRLEDAGDLGAQVVDCAGVGARELAPDPTVTPVRGPKVVVENPGIDHFFIEAPLTPRWTAFHPHGDRLVLGGSTEDGSSDVTPRPDEAEALVRQAAQIDGRLAGAAILEHRVGLRPGRPAIRVEASKIGGSRVVHNYGHAGLGVTCSWGCAVEAVGLLDR